MKNIDAEGYFKELIRRGSSSRVTRDFQLLGLEIADILSDRQHKALYIKYAKEYSPHDLLVLAKSVAERRNVKHPGAYFMRLVQNLKKRE